MKLNKLFFLLILIVCWSCKSDIDELLEKNDEVEQTSDHQTTQEEDEQPATDNEDDSSSEDGDTSTGDDTSLPDEGETGNTTPPDYYDEIALNLSKSGSYDYKLLTGKWALSHYAFTEDGITIKKGEDMRNGYNFHIYELNLVTHVNAWWLGMGDGVTWRVDYTLYPNSYFINLSVFQITYQMYYYQPMITLTEELWKAISFVIKDDKLIIYFKSDIDRNLIVFKKL